MESGRSGVEIRPISWYLLLMDDPVTGAGDGASIWQVCIEADLPKLPVDRNRPAQVRGRKWEVTKPPWRLAFARCNAVVMRAT